MNHFISYRNLRFLLFDMLETENLSQHPAFADFTRDAFDMALDAAKQISETHLFPFYVDMDRKKAVFENGIVKTHPQLKVLIQAIGNCPCRKRRYEHALYFSQRRFTNVLCGKCECVLSVFNKRRSQSYH